MHNLRRKFKGTLNEKQNVLYTISGVLGNDSGVTTVPNRDNYVYVRLAGSGLTEVFNNRVTAVYNLPVVCGYEQANPSRFQVLSIQGAVAEASSFNIGTVGYAPSGRYRWMYPGGGQDPLFVESRQFMPLRISPASGLRIKVNTQVIWNGTEWEIFGGATETDLASYVPDTDGKCCMVLVSIDDEGEIEITTGDDVDIADLAVTDIPEPPVGTRYVLGAIRLYYGQTIIQEARTNTDVVDLRFPMFNNLSFEEILGTLSHTDLDDIGTLTHAELEEAIDDKADISHTHVEDDITDLDHDAVKIDGIAVDLTGITDGQIIKYDVGTTSLIAGDDEGGGALSDLEDVDLTDLADGDVLAYDETEEKWLPVTPASGGASGELTSIGARYTTDAGQSIPDASFTIVNFEDKDYDTDDAVTVGASWKFTAPVSGYYHFDFVLLLTNSSNWQTGEFWLGILFINGTESSQEYRGQMTANATLYQSLRGSDTIYLAKDDYFDIRIYQASGGAISLLNSAQHNHISIHKLGSDIVFQANADIGARVTHDTTQSVANTGFTTLAFNTEKFDTDTIHDTSTNNSRLTCKTTGKYLISANITFAANATGYRQLVFLLNGTTYIASVINQAPTTGGATGSMLISTIYSLTANDYVEVQAAQSSGGALNVLSGSEYTPEFMMQKIDTENLLDTNAFHTNIVNEIGGLDEKETIVADDVFLIEDSEASGAKKAISIGTLFASDQAKCAKVRHASNQNLANDTTVTLAFDTEDYDTDTMHDTSTNNSRITCKTAGKYHIHASVTINKTPLNLQFTLYLNNTTSIAEVYRKYVKQSGYCTINISTDYELDVDDYIEVKIKQDYGETLSALGDRAWTPIFEVFKI